MEDKGLERIREDLKQNQLTVMQELRSLREDFNAALKENRVELYNITNKLHSVDLSVVQLKADSSQCGQDRTQIAKKVEKLETADTENKLKWAKVIGYATGAGLAGGGVIATIIEAFGG